MLNWDNVMSLLTEQTYHSPHGGQRTSMMELREILSHMGHPEERLRCVHVAGTNGKGSASRMLQSVLTAAGYRTGLFISPHLEWMNERWSIDGELIPDEDLRETAARIRKAVANVNEERQALDTLNRLAETGPYASSTSAVFGTPEPQESSVCLEPSAFALLTLMAFDYFARENCDIVVLEVGIGGRLDSTNVIPVPELALIMNLGLEHTELLGNTIEEIAFEKGGIIKQGGRVVLYRQKEAAAERVIRDLCARRGAKLIITEPAALSSSDTGYSYHSHTDIRLSLSGLYQRWNLLAVLDGIDVLRSRGWRIAEEAVREGLRSVTWPGRFEIISQDPLVIVDGAHNPNGVEALLQNLTDPEGPAAGKRLLFVFGVMADKDIAAMLRLLAPYAAGFIMETVSDERAETAEDLSCEARRYYDGPVRTASDLEPALHMALDLVRDSGNGGVPSPSETAVICCGSLYQIAAVRQFFKRPDCSAC